jgi:hypothetical protein
MNPQNHDDLTNELGRAMHHQADGISGSPITLGDVKGTATRIRRRRALTATAAVAAVVAIVVPTAMFTSNLFPNASDDNGVATNSATPTNVTLGEPLDVSNLELGAAPRIAWIEGGRTLHTADGGTVQLDRAYSDVVRYDGGYLATYTDNEGVATGVLLDAIGNRVGDSFATAYSLAVASDGEQVLYVADGKLLVHDNGTGETDTVRTEAGVETEPIAVTSDTAYYNVQLADYSSDARWFREGEEHDPRPKGIYRYTSVGDNGWATAIVAVDDFDGNCTEVTDASGSEAGRTCDLTLQTFSPDGSHILAKPAYYDGYGIRQLTVTNRDGVGTEAAVVLEYLQTGETDATFMDARWEGDSHILAVMTTPVPGTADMTWQLVRIGLDGSVENASDPVRDEELPQFAPFAFAN